MANRQNKFLLKRSNVVGKVPTAGDLLLGEMALNTADGILYTSGTTANTILPIGWDRISRTGDTMTGTLFAPSVSATTISATTYYGDGSNLTGIPDIYVSGATFSTGGTLTINRNDAVDISVSGFATSDQVIVGDSMLDIYETGTTVNNTAGYVDVTWDAQALVGSNYGHTIGSAEITLSASGYYEVVYSISLDRTMGGRSQSRSRLVLDSGGGYNEILRTGAYGYHRTITAGEDTNMKNIKQFFNVGDKIKLQFRIEVGGGALTTIANASNITITKLAI